MASILGELSRVTETTPLGVSVSAMKSYLRVEHDLEDTLIGSLVKAATRYVEREICGTRQILTATYDLPVACWWESLKLPRPPLSSVTSIKYYDTDGTEQTVATSKYLVRTPTFAPGVIERAPDQEWPTDVQADRQYPITIRFVAGYTASSDACPEGLQQAIRMLVAHWYTHREAAMAGSVPQEIAFAVTSLAEAEGFGFYG